MNSNSPSFPNQQPRRTAARVVLVRRLLVWRLLRTVRMLISWPRAAYAPPQSPWLVPLFEAHCAVYVNWR